MNELKAFLQTVLYTSGDTTVTVLNLLLAVLVLVFARILFGLLVRFALKPYVRKRSIDQGRSFAIKQLVKYLVYVIAAFAAIQTTGIDLTLFMAAGAALMVGVGIGLQQTFNDLTSGIVLLIEGTVQKGDWIDIGSMQGQVIEIRLRTSIVETRRRIRVIVPNSKITMDNVINHSHANNNTIRYTVSVGVAYGTDTNMVRDILLKCATEHGKVLKKPAPNVRFMEFGDSALQFDLLFWSNDFAFVEDVRSDLRFMIDDALKQAEVNIPFPQRDVHFKGPLEIKQVG